MPLPSARCFSSLIPWVLLAAACSLEREPSSARLHDSGIEAATQVQGDEPRDYWASGDGSRLEAANRRQRFRTLFRPDGIRVVERDSRRARPLVELALWRVGRPGALERVSAAAPHGDRNRVELRRAGIVEWFENRPEGLEHGFTLEMKPAGEGPVVLELALSGARAERRAADLVLITSSGRRLDYGALAAWDARGRSLATRFGAAGNARIAIEVDDSGAHYPITVDPLLTWTADAVLEGNQVSATFGFQVASAGDVNGDGFEDLIVGAPNYDSGGPLGAGAAFLFLGSAQGISGGGPETAHASFVGNQEFGALGDAVASAGDVNGDGFDDVLVAASNFDGPRVQDEDQGQVYLFLGSAAGIPSGGPATANAVLQGTEAFGFFGASIAPAGDVNGDGFDDILIGSPEWQNSNTTLQEGAAWLFLGSAAGIASGDDADADTRLEGNRSIVGLGRSVASAGDVNGDGFDDVIVGAPGYSFDQVRDGAAFVYLGSAAGIANGNPSTAHARLDGDHSLQPIGRHVASAGDVNGDGFDDVIVGAVEYFAGQIREGAAFVFLGSATGIPSASTDAAHARLESNQENAVLGKVAPAGDVDGDGFDDVLVAATAYDADESDEGAAFVFRGSAAGIASGNPLTAFARLEGGQAGADLGAGLGSGDVNGDGLGDVLVGADRFDAGQADEGVVRVFLGSDVPDNCPYFASPVQADTDGDGRGDPCECTDQNGDGRNTVSDLIAINAAIFSPSLATPLCDGNNDGLCNVNDIVAANVEIFSPTSTSTCSRQPVPGP